MQDAEMEGGGEQRWALARLSQECYSVSCKNSFKTAIHNIAGILQQYLRQTVSLKQQYIIKTYTTLFKAAISPLAIVFK
jgi:hypothetical protein